MDETKKKWMRENHSSSLEAKYARSRDPILGVSLIIAIAFCLWLALWSCAL